jgi:hypothetical protein
MKTEHKRQNFNVTPEQEAEIEWLKDALNAPTTKDALLWAVKFSGVMAREVQRGRTIYLADESGEKERVLIPELERSIKGQWKYLVERPHDWRRQLFIKGRKLLASSVWMDMIVNEQSREEAAYGWDLPVEAIDEVIQYCESNKDLIGMEADEERRLLIAQGISLEPKAST